jgi:hypothetical protein
LGNQFNISAAAELILPVNGGDSVEDEVFINPF